MAPKQVGKAQEGSWISFQVRIERLTRERTRLMDAWQRAMTRACCVPPSYLYDVLQMVSDRYKDVIDAVDSHIKVLQSATSDQYLPLRAG